MSNRSYSLLSIALCCFTSLGLLCISSSIGSATPQVTKQPTLEHAPEIRFPSRAIQEQVGGEVVLRLTIDRHGQVIDANVERSTPKEYGFEQAALAAASLLRFSPAEVDGTPTTVRILYLYRFPKDELPAPSSKTIELITPSGISTKPEIPTIDQKNTKKMPGFSVTVEAVATVPAKTSATVEITKPNAPEVVAANQGDDEGGMVVIIAIIAGVVGGFIVLVIIYLVFCRKSKNSHKGPVVTSTASASSSSSAVHEMKASGV